MAIACGNADDAIEGDGAGNPATNEKDYTRNFKITAFVFSGLATFLDDLDISS